MIYLREDASYDHPEPSTFPLLTSTSAVPSEEHVCMELHWELLLTPK